MPRQASRAGPGPAIMVGIAINTGMVNLFGGGKPGSWAMLRMIISIRARVFTSDPSSRMTASWAGAAAGQAWLAGAAGTTAATRRLPGAPEGKEALDSSGVHLAFI